ncbi:hypothetical protein H0X09_00780 [Candidatus Saccharibacteria bacterium]|nr:hypothetical protein [Candidatus Saccharibacteria bacterium]
MINLLPPAHADNIKYGRINTGLRRWLIALLLAIAGLMVVMVLGWLYIDQQSSDLERKTVSAKQQLDVQDLDKVKKDATELNDSIKTINQVLSQEIRFSALIQDIGKVMPGGTVLASLTLSKVAGAIDLSASSRDYQSAAQIAVNLNDPKNALFDKVDIVNINCSSGRDIGEYKCAATFKALFSKSAQGRYLSVAKEKTP